MTIMKKIMITAIALSIGCLGMAQEKVKKETTTKKMYITDQNGTEVISAKKTKTEKQDLLLTSTEDGTNFNTARGHNKISTTIMFKLNDVSYKFDETPQGYNFMKIS